MFLCDEDLIYVTLYCSRLGISNTCSYQGCEYISRRPHSVVGLERIQFLSIR